MLAILPGTEAIVAAGSATASVAAGTAATAAGVACAKVAGGAVSAAAKGGEARGGAVAAEWRKGVRDTGWLAHRAGGETGGVDTYRPPDPNEPGGGAGLAGAAPRRWGGT